MKENRKNILVRGYLVASVIFLLAFGVLFSIFKIQLTEGDKLDDFTKQNFRLQQVPAERGNLYASDGSLLATTITVHNVHVDLTVIKEDLFESQIGALSDSLGKMFNRPANYFETKFRDERKKGSRYMLLKKGMDYMEYQRLRAFPIFREGQIKGGLIHEKESKRELVLDDIGKRTIGFDDQRGKAGLEGAYSKDLAGVEGMRWEEFMGRQQWKPFKSWEREPLDGSNVYTTIDAPLQIAAFNALNDQLVKFNADHGCVAIMEVETGKIRAMINLKRMEEGVYSDVYNYTVGEGAEPGSTFKTVSLLAGLENEKFTPETTVETGNGSYKLYNRTIRDTHGYGTLTVEEVLKKSSNIGTAKLINNSYGSNPQEYFNQLEKWNLTQKMNIDIEGEAMPEFHRPSDPNWSPVTLPVMSYGYGVKITPLQLLTFYNGIANGGKMLKPLFIDKLERSDETEIEFKPEVLNPKMASDKNIEAITKALTSVVEEGGTANRIASENYSIAGKTGTARVEYWIKDQPIKYRASFVGFFPADHPKYTMIVVIHKPENRLGMYGGTSAAPVFRQLADWIYARTPKKIPSKPTLVNVKKAIQDVPEFKPNYEINKIPNLVGRSGDAIVPILENMGLDVQYTGIGRVTYQSIPPGTPFKRGETIYLNLEG